MRQTAPICHSRSTTTEREKSRSLIKFVSRSRRVIFQEKKGKWQKDTNVFWQETRHCFLVGLFNRRIFFQVNWSAIKKSLGNSSRWFLFFVNNWSRIVTTELQRLLFDEQLSINYLSTSMKIVFVLVFIFREWREEGDYWLLKTAINGTSLQIG